MWTMNTLNQRQRWEKNRVKKTTSRYDRLMEKSEAEKKWRKSGKRPQAHDTTTFLLNSANGIPRRGMRNQNYEGNPRSAGPQEESERIMTGQVADISRKETTEETYVLKTEDTAFRKISSGIGKLLGTPKNKGGTGSMGTVLMLILIIVFLQLVMVVEHLEDGTPVTRMSALFGVFGGKYKLGTTPAVPAGSGKNSLASILAKKVGPQNHGRA